MNDSTRMDESATDQAQGNELDTGQSEQRPLSPREEAMNAVIEKQQEEQQSEAEYLSATKPQAATPIYQNDDGETLLKLKVNGVEQEMPLSEVQATMQKGLAADERFREAAELRRQVEIERQQLHNTNQQPTQAPAGQQPPQGAVNDDLKAQAQSIIDSLYDGDPEDAAEALAQAMARPSTQVTSQQIQQEALKAVQQQEYNENLKSGFQKFESEYSDIMADPDLRDLTDRKTIEIQSLHPDWSPEQILMESGRVIREKIGGQPASPPQNSRQARKQGIQTMPARQSTSTYTPPGKQQPSNNPADVLTRMKQARGQM